MTTIIKSNKGQIFVLFLTGTIEDGFDVLFVSGTRLWHNITKIDYDCRPASRKRDTKENFMHSLYVAFTQSNYQPAVGGRLFDYDLTVSDLDNQLSIVIKEQLAGTSTLSLLFKDTFISKDNSDEVMNQLWISHILNMNKLEGEATKKEILLQGYKEDNKILLEKIQNLENDRYQNVTSLFNPLKRENQRLRTELQAGNNKSGAGTAMEEEDMEELEDLPRAKKATTTKTTRKPAAKGKASSSAVDSILQKVKKASAATTKKLPAKRGRKAAALSSDEEAEVVDEASSTDMTEDEEAIAPPVPTIRAVSSKPPAATQNNGKKEEEEDDDDITVMDSDEEQEMFHAQPTNVWSMSSVKESYSFPSSSVVASSVATASSSLPVTFAKNTFTSSVSREDAESPILSTKTNSFSQSNVAPVLISSGISSLPSTYLSTATTASVPTTTTTTTTTTTSSAIVAPATSTTTTANPKKATRSNRFFEDSDDD